RSGPGLLTGMPSTRTSPLVGCSKPAIRLSSVDLPQPLAPTRVTNSRSATTTLIPASATTWPPAPKVLLTFLTSILATKRFLHVPCKEIMANKNNQPVGQKPQQSDAEHGRDHDIIAIKEICIVEQVAEPAAHGQDLGDDDEHPGDAHGEANARKNGG